MNGVQKSIFASAALVLALACAGCSAFQTSPETETPLPVLLRQEASLRLEEIRKRGVFILFADPKTPKEALQQAETILKKHIPAVRTVSRPFAALPGSVRSGLCDGILLESAPEEIRQLGLTPGPGLSVPGKTWTLVYPPEAESWSVLH